MSAQSEGSRYAVARSSAGRLARTQASVGWSMKRSAPRVAGTGGACSGRPPGSCSAAASPITWLPVGRVPVGEGSRAAGDGRAGALLDDVRELVRQQPGAAGRPRPVLAGAEHHVATDRVGARAERTG